MGVVHEGVGIPPGYKQNNQKVFIHTIPTQLTEYFSRSCHYCVSISIFIHMVHVK